MMEEKRFINPKDGALYVVNEKNQCSGSGFCYGISCFSCKIRKVRNTLDCWKWVIENPERAAKLMGYTLLENQLPTQDKNTEDTVTRSSILESARKCVCGDRDEQYGSPENSFTAISNLWNGYLESIGCIFPEGEKLTARDTAAMMVLFKIARVATGAGKADNWIDAAGYAACGGEIEGGTNK